MSDSTPIHNASSCPVCRLTGEHDLKRFRDRPKDYRRHIIWAISQSLRSLALMLEKLADIT